MERVYTTFFDYLGNLGGVFEIILFAFAIMMQIHSGIEMDLYLLNHIVLHDQWVDKEENQPRGNQVADIS